MTELKLEITQADLDAGSHDGGDCPIARALKRVCSLPFHVTRHHLVFYNSHDRSCKQIGSIRLPRELHQFIDDYDSYPKRPVFPFTFVWTVDLSSFGA